MRLGSVGKTSATRWDSPGAATPPCGSRDGVRPAPGAPRSCHQAPCDRAALAGSDAFADPLVWAASVEVLHPFGRRARDAEVRGDGHVPGALDEIPKSVDGALLRAGLGRHGHDGV